MRIFGISILSFCYLLCALQQNLALAQSEMNPAYQFNKPPIDSVLIHGNNSEEAVILIFGWINKCSGQTKDFAIVDQHTRTPLFVSNNRSLSLKEETDPINGKYDSIIMNPIYQINMNDSARITLAFEIQGFLALDLLTELTYDFYGSMGVRGTFRLNFLDIEINRDSLYVCIKPAFLARPCNLDEKDSILVLKALMDADELMENAGITFIRDSFICQLSKESEIFKSIREQLNFKYQRDYEFSQSYTYHPFVAYLSEFVTASQCR